MIEPTTPEFSIDTLHQQLWHDIRSHRDKLLTSADIQINKLIDSGGDISAWSAYRQQLRDVPNSVDDPTQVVWPSKPA